ncbi:chemotaxis protein CheW [Bradyrhizobium betae]|uniref:chemotaxis protein CheW n=2 Tax=Bradyrhizobium TaxID=374 RepID=UPI00211EBD49|nr:chemotaxis protein CheW [Bradyrhizobium betae]
MANNKTQSSDGAMVEYVTAMIGGQLFGLPISRVQDVFMPERVTRVPLSSREIAGVLNLRGRIVTVVDMRARLGLPQPEDGKVPMAVGVDLPTLYPSGVRRPVSWCRLVGRADPPGAALPTCALSTDVGPAPRRSVCDRDPLGGLRRERRYRD